MCTRKEKITWRVIQLLLATHLITVTIFCFSVATMDALRIPKLLISSTEKYSSNYNAYFILKLAANRFCYKIFRHISLVDAQTNI